MPEKTRAQKFAIEEPEVWGLMCRGYTETQAREIVRRQEAKIETTRKIEESERLLENDRLSTLREELMPLVKEIEESRELVERASYSLENDKVEYEKEVRERIDMDVEALVQKYVSQAFKKLDERHNAILNTQAEIDDLMDALFSKLEKMSKKSE
jgi:hypothetical protein